MTCRCANIPIPLHTFLSPTSIIEAKEIMRAAGYVVFRKSSLLDLATMKMAPEPYWETDERFRQYVAKEAGRGIFHKLAEERPELLEQTVWKPRTKDNPDYFHYQIRHRFRFYPARRAED